MSEREKVRLDPDNINRADTTWVFENHFNIDIKVVLDRQPLLGTGPLPDWLRNLAHSRSMLALDTYKDNLCLWRCIAVHRGARPDRSTTAAREPAKSFFNLIVTPNDCRKLSLDELDQVERHLNQKLNFSDWLGIRVYESIENRLPGPKKSKHRRQLSRKRFIQNIQLLQNLFAGSNKKLSGGKFTFTTLHAGTVVRDGLSVHLSTGTTMK